jgi:hypothetical protein
MRNSTTRPNVSCFERFVAYAPFVFFVLLPHPPKANAAEAYTQVAFSVDEPFSEVVSKMDSEQSLTRVLLSQNIRLVEFEVTKRSFNPETRTLDGELRIEAFAPRISCSLGEISQTVQLGVNQAKLELFLLAPLGQLAEHRYTVDFVAQDEQTTVTIGLYSRVFVPQRRLCRVQRLVNRIARRRVNSEVQWAVAELRQSISTIVSEDRPADAKSMLLDSR